MDRRRIKLSEMKVGDTGYLPSEGAFVELREGGRAGGCEHDLFLALIDGEKLRPADWYPTIIVDTDNVSI